MSATYSRRDRPARRYLLCAAVAVAGIGIGIGLSMFEPWGFAPAPGSLPEPVPQAACYGQPLLRDLPREATP